MKDQIRLNDALKIINNIDQVASGEYYLRCNCISNGIKYLYTYLEYWEEDNRRSPENFITKVTAHGSFLLTIYNYNDIPVSTYQLIDENGNPL